MHFRYEYQTLYPHIDTVWDKYTNNSQQFGKESGTCPVLSSRRVVVLSSEYNYTTPCMLPSGFPICFAILLSLCLITFFLVLSTPSDLAQAL